MHSVYLGGWEKEGSPSDTFSRKGTLEIPMTPAKVDVT